METPERRLLILEDEAARREAMSEVAAQLGLALGLYRRSRELIEAFSQLADDPAPLVLSLDFDLIHDEQGEFSFELGNGREVTQALILQSRRVPTILHSANTRAVPLMLADLEGANWLVRRVVPYTDVEWIYDTWRRTIEELFRQDARRASDNMKPTIERPPEPAPIEWHEMNTTPSLSRRLLILEDEASRREAMLAVAAEIGANIEFHRSSKDYLAAFERWAREPRAFAISLDHDLLYDEAGALASKLGDGREVTRALSLQDRKVPAIIHSSNPYAVPSMIMDLELAGWAVYRVTPHSDTLWIRESWKAQILEIIEGLSD